MKNLKKIMYGEKHGEYFNTMINMSGRVIMLIDTKTRIEIYKMSITDTVRDAIDGIRK